MPASQTFLSMTLPWHCCLQITQMVTFHHDTTSEKTFPQCLWVRIVLLELKIYVTAFRERKVAQFILVIPKFYVHNRKRITLAI